MQGLEELSALPGKVASFNGELLEGSCRSGLMEGLLAHLFFPVLFFFVHASETRSELEVWESLRRSMRCMRSLFSVATIVRVTTKPKLCVLQAQCVFSLLR